MPVHHKEKAHPPQSFSFVKQMEAPYLFLVTLACLHAAMLGRSGPADVAPIKCSQMAVQVRGPIQAEWVQTVVT